MNTFTDMAKNSAHVMPINVDLRTFPKNPVDFEIRLH